MKEILEAIRSRISTPLFGYLIFSFLVINWKPLFYLLSGEVTALQRIEYFESNTTYMSILILPVGFAVFGTIIYPWINYLFISMCKKPTYLINCVQAQSEHALLIEKQNLEQTRASLLASREIELIERAERDKKLENIDDSDTKEKIKSEIEKLRIERDYYINHSETSPPFVTDKAQSYKQKTNQLKSNYNKEKANEHGFMSDKAQKYKQMANKLKSIGDQEEANEYMLKAIEIEKNLVKGNLTWRAK